MAPGASGAGGWCGVRRLNFCASAIPRLLKIEAIGHRPPSSVSHRPRARFRFFFTPAFLTVGQPPCQPHLIPKIAPHARNGARGRELCLRHKVFEVFFFANLKTRRVGIVGRFCCLNGFSFDLKTVDTRCRRFSQLVIVSQLAILVIMTNTILPGNYCTDSCCFRLLGNHIY